MESKAKFLGHPVHQMLVVFPLGLLAMAVLFDVVVLATDHAGLSSAAYYMIVAGVVAGLIAAPFGTIDFLAIPDGTRAKRVGLVHGVGNAFVLMLFLASWLVRGDAAAQPDGLALALSFVGAALALLTAWLGGELVSRLAIGVSDGAHADAPSSLSTRETARAGVPE